MSFKHKRFCTHALTQTRENRRKLDDQLTSNLMPKYNSLCGNTQHYFRFIMIELLRYTVHRWLHFVRRLYENFHFPSSLCFFFFLLLRVSIFSSLVQTVFFSIYIMPRKHTPRGDLVVRWLCTMRLKRGSAGYRVVGAFVHLRGMAVWVFLNFLPFFLLFFVSAMFPMCIPKLSQLLYTKKGVYMPDLQCYAFVLVFYPSSVSYVR